MHIDKYKIKDDGYEDPTGCWWETAEDFLQGYVLDFCCCGLPEDNLKFIAKVLDHVDDLKISVWSEHITYAEWHAKGSNIANASALSFAYYFLDQKEFTEHGGSIPGWLTNSGRELLEDINELYLDN